MPKKILLYTRPLVPPWDEASKNLAWEIAKNSSNNFQFEILTTKKSGSSLEGFEKEETAEKRKVGERFQDFLNRDNKEKITPRPIFSSANFNQVAKIQLLNVLYGLNPKKVDIIHFLFTPRPLTSFLIRRKLKKLPIKTVQTIATLNEKFYRNPQKIKKIIFANTIVAQSNYTFKKLQKAGIGNLELIYPAVNLEKFQHQEKDQNLMKKFSIESGEFVILFPGEYVRLKAVDDIINALKILSSREPQIANFKLILACRIKSKKDIKKREKIKKQVKKFNLEKNVIFIETFANMPKLYNLADLVIFPVREMVGKFDIPLALIEAMACEKPVIISDIPVLKEFIKHKETGLVIPKADPEKLAYAINQAIQFPEETKKIATQGLMFARENFDIRKNIKKYEEVYQKL